MSKDRILVVEDEELMRNILRELLESAGYEVFAADSAENAIQIFNSNDILITLTDIKMSGRDGLDLLDHIKSIDEEAAVIIMTAYSSVDTAIAALRKGAYDYLTKPFVNEDLLQTVKNAAMQRRLSRENRSLRRELRTHYRYSEIVGKSAALKGVFDLIEKVADTTANVLISGESGTGKELVARSIHFNSGRSSKPFLAVNCGALTESLLESELFGHIKGSFTGAITDKKGLFRSVAGGTLFLDEIGEMPLSLQVKLLRALQEYKVTPVGSSSAIAFDARIVAATNRNIDEEINSGRFREDLYYRLNVVEIVIPPLRDRSEDIPMLVKHFISNSARRQGTPEKSLVEGTLDILLKYSWPGNVRELEHVIERAMILSDDMIRPGDLPPKLLAASGATDISDHPQTLDAVEKKYILEIMELSKGDKSAAARTLGIDLSTLYRKLKRFELD